MLIIGATARGAQDPIPPHASIEVDGEPVDGAAKGRDRCLGFDVPGIHLASARAPRTIPE